MRKVVKRQKGPFIRVIGLLILLKVCKSNRDVKYNKMTTANTAVINREVLRE